MAWGFQVRGVAHTCMMYFWVLAKAPGREASLYCWWRCGEGDCWSCLYLAFRGGNSCARWAANCDSSSRLYYYQCRHTSNGNNCIHLYAKVSAICFPCNWLCMIIDVIHYVFTAPFSAKAKIFCMYFSPVFRISLPKKVLSSFTNRSGVSYSLISPRSRTRILS